MFASLSASDTVCNEKEIEIFQGKSESDTARDFKFSSEEKVSSFLIILILYSRK